jgi:hypothetical protein
MSEEHVEIVRRFYEAFMRGDGEAALALYSRDAEWDDTRFRPEGKVHQGHEGLVELVRTWVGTWTDYSFDLSRVVDAGERIVAICEEHGTGKGSGLPGAAHGTRMAFLAGRGYSRSGGTSVCPESSRPQQRTRPERRTPQECTSPALTERNLPVGGSDCPYSSSPQQRASPLVLTPHVWPFRVSTEANRPDGGEAAPRSKPQQRTLPPRRIPQLWIFPAVTERNPPPGGVAWSCSSRPQHSTLASALIPQV